MPKLDLPQHRPTHPRNLSKPFQRQASFITQSTQTLPHLRSCLLVLVGDRIRHGGRSVKYRNFVLDDGRTSVITDASMNFRTAATKYVDATLEANPACFVAVALPVIVQRCCCTENRR